MLGPIEVLVIGFPGSKFTGGILPELEKLVESETITVLDAVVIVKDDNGDVDFLEFDQIDKNDDLAALGEFLDEPLEMLSDADMHAFADELDPGSSAAALVFEHTLFKACRYEPLHA